jgi:predicted Zn-dependent protease
MNRRTLLRLAFAAAGLGSASGCLDGFPFGDGKPKQPTVTPASVETARRVDDLAKRIVEQNTFTGLEPIIRVIGVPEAVLFHRGPTELFISEGLVKKCKTEPELAAVLCTELGKMKAQKQAAVRVGRAPDPIPEIALPGGSSDASRVREAELALLKRREDQKRAAEESGEAQLAKDLLKGAGFDPAEFDRVQGMVKQSARGDAIQKPIAGTAPAPVWNR